MEDSDNIIVLPDENGNDEQFEFLDIIEYQGRSYVVLLPLDEDGEAADQVVILLDDGLAGSDEHGYTSPDDEAALDAVYRIFKERFKDEFNFDD